MSRTKDQKPFALPDTLRDLALLRVSDLDLTTLLPSSSDSARVSEEDQAIQESLRSSYAYVRESRAVLKINDRGDVDVQGQRIEDAREKLADVEEGLAGA